MTTKDEAARRARAVALRKRIGGLTGGAPAPAKPPGDETPAEFVHRRMRELDKPPKKPR
jgi:hypothetical protein